MHLLPIRRLFPATLHILRTAGLISRSFSAMATAAAQAVKIKVDASAEGCSGMFYRVKPEMSATSNDPNWPRNGTVLEGVWETHGGERWVKFTNGYYLPEKQKGYTILTEVK